jgi:arylsulfatase A-like enzyme
MNTPNIDRLATEGARFDRAYVTNSICGPSRAATITGKYSHKSGFYANLYDFAFDETQWTFPKTLRNEGYWTGIVGKYHVGPLQDFSETASFDYSNILISQGDYYSPDTLEQGSLTRHEGIHATDLTTDLAIGVLNNTIPDGKPWLLFVNHKAPHRNWMSPTRHLGYFGDREWPVPSTFFDKFEGREAAGVADMSIKDMYWSDDQKLYIGDMEDPGTGGAGPVGDPQAKYNGSLARMTPAQLQAWEAFYQPLTDVFFENGPPTGEALALHFYQGYMREYLQSVVGVDESVGAVLDFLEAKGTLDNTLVLYTSDQGFYLGEHGFYDKRFMYETSFRTPLLMRLPGVIAPGTTSEHLVMNLDFASTILDIAGLADKIPDEVQGESFASVFDTAAADGWRRDAEAIYYHFYENPGWHGVKRHYGARTAQHKLIHYYSTDVDAWELFDLDADPWEMTNLYGLPEHSTTQADMHATLADLRLKYDDACPPRCEDTTGPMTCPLGSVDKCNALCAAEDQDYYDCLAGCEMLCSPREFPLIECLLENQCLDDFDLETPAEDRHGLGMCLINNDCIVIDDDAGLDVGALTRCVQSIPIVNPEPPCGDDLDIADVLDCISSCGEEDSTCALKCFLDSSTFAPGLGTYLTCTTGDGICASLA